MEIQEATGKKYVTVPISYFGRRTIRTIGEMGASAIFLIKAILLIFRPKQFPAVLEQIYFIGARSSNIVILIALFTGMVLGLQLYHALVKVGSQGALGSVLALSLIRELGPVLAAIMITARAGSSMTAEIGMLRVSEQIDALFSMRINPLRYLVSPRVAAAIVSFPILTGVFDLVGILGGYLTSVLLLGLDSGTFFYGIRSSVEMEDINGGIVKSIVFAVLVSTTCCFQGFFTHMREDSVGAKGVGLSTTSAVVLSCVFILMADYIVTSFLM